MSSHLTYHLWPKGRSENEPDLMPNVHDSDGEAVTFNSPKRKTTEATVVDLGDSPNSNNGDPLRTAFAKVNNFIEASYWTNEGVNQRLADIDSELREGIFIYTDSEERYNISLLDNSRLYLQGYPNQIQVSASRMKSPNNPYDFDSEVRISFEFPEEVIIPGDFRVRQYSQFDSDVYISGNLWVEGTRTELNAETVTVKDNFISMNWDSQNQVAIKGTTGFVFNSINADNGIVEWDTATNTLTIGETTNSGDSETPAVSVSYSKLDQARVRYYDTNGSTVRSDNTFGATNTSTVTGNLVQNVSGDVTENYSQDVTTNVTQDYNVNVTVDYNKVITGNDNTTVNGVLNETVAGLATYNYNGGLTQNITGSINLGTTGSMAFTAGNDITLSADGDTITLNNGSGSDSIVYQLGDTTTATVSGSFTDVVTTNYVETIGGTSTTTVTGAVTENYNSTQTTTIAGTQTTTVNGGNATTNVTAGNYTLDVSGDITLDADGNDIVFKNGAGNDTVTHTLADDGNYTLTTPNNYYVSATNDIYLQPTGDNVFMQGTTSSEQLNFNLQTGFQAIVASDSLALQSAPSTTVSIGDTTKTNIMNIGTSVLPAAAPFVIHWNATDSVWDITGDGTGRIDGGTF